MLSVELHETLYRALAHANKRRHEYATLEHLLLALTEDRDAVATFRTRDVDFGRLQDELLDYVDRQLHSTASSTGDNAKPTRAFQRVLQRAAIRAQSDGHEEVTGANVLEALLSEPMDFAPRNDDLEDSTLEKE